LKIRMDTGKTTLWKINEAYQCPPHKHEEDCQITIPVYGTSHILIDSKTIHLADGEGLIIHPGEHHELHIPHESSVIVIQTNYYKLTEITGMESMDYQIKYRFKPEVMNNHFRKWTETLLRQDIDQLENQETEQHVFSFLMSNLMDKLPLTKKAIRSNLSDRMNPIVIEYMHDHYKDQLNLNTLAEMACQSKYHFIRTFKEAIGIPPYQYLLQLRIEEAKTKLRTTCLTVTDISFELGFSSTSQFYRIFHQATGTTPKHFRAHCK